MFETMMFDAHLQLNFCIEMMLSTVRDCCLFGKRFKSAVDIHKKTDQMELVGFLSFI
jgi:hypothetical protein